MSAETITPAAPVLLTAAELAPMFGRSTKQVLHWKRIGLITAEVDTGRNIQFDPEKVKAQLAKKAAKKSRGSKAKPEGGK